MIGRDLKALYTPPQRARRADVLEIARPAHRDLSRPRGRPRRSGTARSSALAGLVGSGRTELARALFGIDPHARRRRSGSMASRSAIASPRDAIARGIFLVPEDRKRSGLLLDFRSPRTSRCPTCAPIASAACLIRQDAEAEQRREAARAARHQAPSVDDAVGTLSGGNQQKVVLAKWLSMKPEVMIFDEPTRGIDVGAKNRDLRADARAGRCAASPS